MVLILRNRTGGSENSAAHQERDRIAVRAGDACTAHTRRTATEDYAIKRGTASPVMRVAFHPDAFIFR